MSSAWQSSFAGRDAAAAQSSYRSLPLKWSVAAASLVSCSSCIAPCLEVSDTNTTARLDLLTAVAVPLSAATHDPFMLQHADHCPSDQARHATAHYGRSTDCQRHLRTDQMTCSTGSNRRQSCGNTAQLCPHGHGLHTALTQQPWQETTLLLKPPYSQCLTSMTEHWAVCIASHPHQLLIYLCTKLGGVSYRQY